MEAHRFKERGVFPVAAKLALVVVLLLFWVSAVFALPRGQQVVSGQASFNTHGSNLTITNSPNAIINWQGFSINAGEAVRFAQQSASSAVLNRIIGQDPSRIFGLLQSNGRVFLVNPNGIVFGQGARIDVNGLVASTLNIGNQDFLAGKYNFNAGAVAGPVKNQGAIVTPTGGTVYLIAPDIDNSGIINSPGGDVLLAAGHQVRLVDSLDPDIAVVVSAPENKAMNLGHILAQSGRIGIYGGLIAQKGIVNADSAIVGESGRIVLRAAKNIDLDAGSVTSANGTDGGIITVHSDSGTARLSGTVTATGASGRGGDVKILGDRVELAGSALVDASGGKGGGNILIGGDFQGKNPAVKNAGSTSVGKDVAIRADALESGAGGKVVLWADDKTEFYGRISARGGTAGGDGGNAEVSGKQTLVYRGLADLRAPLGKTGTLLLDPTNIIIAAVGGDMTGDDVENQLLAANVTIQTSGAGAGAGDITVNDPINWTTANTLTLSAHNNVNINQDMSNTANSSLVLRADSDGSGAGNVVFAGSGAMTFAPAGGTASIFYNPPAGYGTPTNYAANFTGVTPTAYMLVNNVNDLQNMNINLAGRYALGKDIDASPTVGWPGGAGFLPVGTLGARFSGMFDGLGHTITGLFINRPATDYVGLFGAISTATINNVGLVDVNVTGQGKVGGLVGGQVVTAGGTTTINNSYGTGAVTGNASHVGGLVGRQDALAGGGATATIQNSYSTCIVRSTSGVGGLVGIQDVSGTGTVRIIDSCSTGAVTGTAGEGIGGLAGWQQAIGGTALITGSYNTGAVTGPLSYVGGLIGGQGAAAGGTATVSNSYSTGNVTGNLTGPGDATAGIGGLVGRLFGGAAAITNSYSTGRVTGTTNVGGLIGTRPGGGPVTSSYWDTVTSGLLVSAGGTGRTTAQMKQQATFAGWDFVNIWNITENTTYPYLRLAPTPAAPAPAPVPAPAMTTISGGLDIPGSGRIIQAVIGGVPIGQTTTLADGSFIFTVNQSLVPGGSAILAYVSGNGVRGASVYPSGANIQISAGALTASNDGGQMSNTILGTAKGGLAAGDIIYNVSGTNLTLADGIGFRTTAGTYYYLDGNVTTTNAWQVYGGPLTLAANVALRNIGSGNITFGGPVYGTGNILSLNTAGTVTQSAPIQVGGLELLGSGAIYELTHTDNAVATLAGNTGTVNLKNSTDIVIGTVNGTTGLHATAEVTLQSGGAIIHGTGGSTAITTPVLSLFAASGIGSGNPLMTAVENLSAVNTVSNNIEIDNTGILRVNDIRNLGTGNVRLQNIGEMTTGVAQIASGGTVNMTAHSPLTIGPGGVSAFSSIALEAADSGGADDLTINGAVASSNGNIFLKAGRSITIGPGGSLSCPNGTITMDAPVTPASAGGVAASGNTVVAFERIQGVIARVEEISNPPYVSPQDDREEYRKKKSKEGGEKGADEKKRDDGDKMFCN